MKRIDKEGACPIYLSLADARRDRFPMMIASYID